MQNHSFRTPFQLLHQWLRDNNRDIGYQQDQPDITFLKAYGCRAYPLTPQAIQNRQKKDLKTDPHTEIGYLVGYDSTNIFRIWIPSTSEVRRVRDVTFNESIFYDGNDQPPEPIPHRVKYSFQPTSRTSRITRKSPLKSMNLNLTPLSNLPQPQTKETPPRLWYNPNHLIARTRMIRMSFMTFSTHIRHRTPVRVTLSHGAQPALQSLASSVLFDQH
ncbi:reverse transcriptase (RNA-dependent DNA polymerase) [Hirsutella rhossiliensis]